MDLNDLRYLTLVVDHGGFSAASRHAHVTKSKLSRRIGVLEKQLGVRLLQRNTRRLALTEAGRLYYERCAAMMIEAEAAAEVIEQLRSEPSGTVRLTCQVSMAQFYIARMIADFVRRHPKIRVELDATDRPVNLIQERFDIAVSTSFGSLDPGLIKRRIASGPFILVAAASYLENCPAIDDPDQIASLDTIGAVSAGVPQTWSLTNPAGGTAKVHVQPRMLCSDLVSQWQAVLGGAGIALLPKRVVARGAEDGSLVHILPGWGIHDLDIDLVYSSRRGMLPSVRALIDHLAACIPSTLQAWP